MKKRKETWEFIGLGGVAIVSVIALLSRFPASFAVQHQFLAESVLWGLLLASILGLVGWGWYTQRAQDTSLTQMDFMHQMTHELQTPVASIRLATDMLTSPVVGQSPEKWHKYVHIIQEESQRMQWHIENVLNIAQAENNALNLNLELTPLNDVVNSVVERYDGIIKADYQAQQAMARVDRLHLTNVLHNLLENALKYSPDNPAIYVSTYDRDGSYVVAIRDNGVGIAPSERDKIFQKFYRIPDTSAHVKGFGLGLSYVKQIANAHCWQLELDSEVGKGSEFRVAIPPHKPAV